MVEILRTGEQARHPWPEGMFIQGGKSGLVLSGDTAYTTAFVEAFPEGTFLRGEGETVADAEDACWARYERMTSCPAHPQHGPFEARGYTNGAGFCTRCGGWFSRVLPEQPDQPGRKYRLLDRLVAGAAELDGVATNG